MNLERAIREAFDPALLPTEQAYALRAIRDGRTEPVPEPAMQEGARRELLRREP